MKNVRSALLVAAALMVYPVTAGATLIEYQATNVSGNIWRYDYFVSDHIFAAQQGFAVFFDDGLYELLQATLLPPGWDLEVIDPDTQLGSRGWYDALALGDDPLYSGPFSVSFTWLGAGTPGSQDFEVYDLNASGFPAAGETGVTTLAQVPEPSTLLLFSAGAVVGWRFRARRKPAASI